jgi:peptide/nickel transport system substrate-binding protein
MNPQDRITRRQFLALCSTAAISLLVGCVQAEAPTKPAAPPADTPKPESPASKYQEPPSLANLVETGELEPVDQRLPKDPLVVPRKGGKHGGTFRMVTTDKNPSPWDARNNGAMQAIPMRLSEDLKGYVPNWYSDCKYSDDKKTIRCSIRPGTKYSNGMEHTADDWVFWHDYILTDTQVFETPYDYYTAGGEIMQIKKVDNYTFDIIFKEPKPQFVIQCFAHCLGFWGSHVLPAKWMEQFHPKFNDKADEEAKAAGFTGYGTRMFFENKQEISARAGAPFSGAFMVTKVTPSNVTWERNPYFYAVDQDGKQLPYLDSMLITIVENNEIAQAQALAGQSDRRNIAFKDYQTFAEAGQKNGFVIYDWTQVQNYCVFNWNMTAKDPVWRKVFQDVRFRRAMSLALNREEMNQVAFAGACQVSQFTADPSTPYWKKEYAEAYTKYDVDEANKLLDEMGLKWDDKHELRVLEDGRPAQISTQVWSAMIHQVFQLAVDYWLEVGIKLDYKSVERNVTHDSTMNNDLLFSTWNGDEVGSVLLGSRPKFLVPAGSDESCAGQAWTLWYTSNGEKGEEPPAEIKQLYEWHTNWTQTGDPQYMDNMLKFQAENLMTVGTLVGVPNPVIFNKDLVGVPKEKPNGWDTLDVVHIYPEAWWFNR